MGITLYYEFHSDYYSQTEASDALKLLREHAVSSSFLKVTELEVWDGERVSELKRDASDTQQQGAAVLLSQASAYVCSKEFVCEFGEDCMQRVEPDEFVRFTLYPGEGCETAAIGLSRFPSTFIYEGREWPTGLSTWHWHSFCKTQFAANPKCGGIDHFLKCHLGLISFFDYADELGILRRVGDDSGYWESRDESRLRESVEEMNQMIAAIAGSFRDATPEPESKQVQSPIFDFPNFEHLEAEGRDSES
jgi:hypothetical protein